MPSLHQAWRGVASGYVSATGLLHSCLIWCALAVTSTMNTIALLSSIFVKADWAVGAGGT